MRTTIPYRVAVVLCIGVMAAVTTYAQTATVTGTVSDATGAGVPSVKVTAKNQATASVRTAFTDSSGTYQIPNVAVGKYDITMEKEGFTTLRFQGVELTVAQGLTLNGKLEVGAVSQTVDVTGASVAPINLEDAQLSNVVDSRRILDFPLITRDPYQLVLLSPGAQGVESSLGGFSINGQRERNNNFLLDGTDNNDASVPGIPGGISTINPDSTQEFRVITNNYLPEFGRNSGAIIDVVTRSGTNQFHGNLYEFNRVNATGCARLLQPCTGSAESIRAKSVRRLIRRPDQKRQNVLFRQFRMGPFSDYIDQRKRGAHGAVQNRYLQLQWPADQPGDPGFCEQRARPAPRSHHAEGPCALSQSERPGGRLHTRHLLLPDRHSAGQRQCNLPAGPPFQRQVHGLRALHLQWPHQWEFAG